MRPLTCVLSALLISSTIATSQSAPPNRKDPGAASLASQILAASGPTFSAETGSKTTGTITFAGDSNQYPIRIVARGNDRVRTEVDWSTGTSVRVINKGQGAFQNPAGRVIKFNPINSLSERISHIPALSLLSEFPMKNTEIRDEEPATVGGTVVVRISVAWSDAATKKDQDEFLKRTRVIYSVDPRTLQILQVEYSRSAENDTNAITHYRVVYSDYQMMSGRLVPALVTTFADDKLASELRITSYTENSDISSSSFSIPEASK